MLLKGIGAFIRVSELNPLLLEGVQGFLPTLKSAMQST